MTMHAQIGSFVAKDHDRRGKRTPATLLQPDERDRYLIEAACHFPGLSDREVGRRLRSRLLIYQQGAWRARSVRMDVQG